MARLGAAGAARWEGSVHDPDGSSDCQTAFFDKPRELTYLDSDNVDSDTFLATF